MAENENQVPGIATLVARLAGTSVGALRNRFELLAVEWQEERAHLFELLVWSAGLLFMGIMGAILLTATIVFLFPEDLRLYVLGAFTVVYLAGAFGAWLAIRSLLKREPFAESIDQAKKDQAWLKSLD